jgi:hypothetical protein
MAGRTRYKVEEFPCSDDDEPLRPRPPAKLEKAWVNFRSVFNGKLHKVLVHYCSDEACCKGYDISESRRRMTAAIEEVMFNSLPTVPVKSKWLQTGPCVDWFMVSMVAMSTLQALWTIAFCKGSKTKKKDPVSGFDDLGYHELVGKRLASGEVFVRSPSSPPVLIVAAIVSEPLRFLTGWFLSRRSHANRSKPAHWQCCPLMDLLNPLVSPIVRVLQYFGCCIRGEAARLRLLWGMSDCTSFQEWARLPEHSDSLAMLRRALTIAASWTFRRFLSEGMCWPWRAASLADLRIPMPDRMKIARELFDSPAERLDIYFAARLKARLGSAEDMFQEDMQDAIRHWAWSVRCSISDTEYVHGRNHRRAHPGQSWQSFVAVHINAEARLTHQEAQKAPTLKPASLDADLDIAGAGPKKGRVRKMSAQAAFKRDWFPGFASPRPHLHQLSKCARQLWGK